MYFNKHIESLIQFSAIMSNSSIAAWYGKKTLLELDDKLHEAVEQADVSSIMKWLKEGAEVRINE